MSTSFRSLIFRLPIIRVNKTFTPPPLDSRSRVLSRGSEHSVRFVFFFFFFGLCRGTSLDVRGAGETLDLDWGGPAPGDRPRRVIDQRLARVRRRGK